MSQIPEDLREMFESSKLDTTMFVGSQIRTLIMRIARLEAENGRLKALMSDEEWEKASYHQAVSTGMWTAPKSPDAILNWHSYTSRANIDAMIAARTEPAEESTQPKGKAK